MPYFLRVSRSQQLESEGKTGLKHQNAEQKLRQATKK